MRCVPAAAAAAAATVSSDAAGRQRLARASGRTTDRAHRAGKTIPSPLQRLLLLTGSCSGKLKHHHHHHRHPMLLSLNSSSATLPGRFKHVASRPTNRQTDYFTWHPNADVGIDANGSMVQVSSSHSYTGCWPLVYCELCCKSLQEFYLQPPETGS